MSDIVQWINILAIIAIGIIGFVYQWQVAKKMRANWQWIKYCLALISLAWSLFYIFIGISGLTGFNSEIQEIIRSWIVRPMILLTLGFIAASGIARGKTNGY
jgi:hypothetical protein